MHAAAGLHMAIAFVHCLASTLSPSTLCNTWKRVSEAKDLGLALKQMQLCLLASHGDHCQSAMSMTINVIQVPIT